jgi:hypothetical protein
MTTSISEDLKTDKISKDGSKRHEFIVELAEKVRQDDQDREVWKQKQIIASNQRQGVRRRTNSPYPGYQEVPIPTTDKVIKQKKTIFTSVATTPAKQIVVSVDGDSINDTNARASAQKIEKALNGLIRKKDFKWAKSVTLFVDYFLENGHAVFKVIEKFFSRISHETIEMSDFTDEQLAKLKKMKDKQLTEIIAQQENLDPEDDGDLKVIKSIIKQFRAGKEVIKYDRRDFFSEPAVIPVRGLRIIVPHGTTDVKTATRITHDMWVSYEYLKLRADEGVYNKTVVDALTPESGTVDDSMTNVNWALTEGLTNTQSGSGAGELFNVRESQTWYLNPDTNKLEKWVFTWLEQSGETQRTQGNVRTTSAQSSIKILQEIKLPFANGKWSYVKHDLEYKNTRWYNSRGVPEQIRGMHIITEKMFNARVIRDTYNNAPMFRVSKQLGWSGDEMRIRPGQFLEAEAGQIEQINKAISVDVSSSQIESQAKAYIEEYQAIPDLARTNAATGGEKTATEVQAVTNTLNQQASSEISLFLESLSEVATQMYDILKQSVTGPRIIGGVMLTPEDFAVKVNTSWVGSIEAANLGLQSQKIIEKIQLMNTVAMPLGLSTKQDMYNALKLLFEMDPDVEDPNMFLTEPQEVLVDQAENQMNELIMMTNGFMPQVKPDDVDETHIQVIEEWIQTPEGQAAMQNPAIAQRVQQHANVHMQQEQMKQGGNGGGGNSGGSNLSTARRQAALTASGATGT